jgi:UDPglucose--hexose-1-phosphate uridylyltransferase
MADLRFDPVTHQWVSVAENRRNRPVEFVPTEQARHQIICPFCAGNEDETPFAIAAYDRHLQPMDLDVDEAQAWSVRVIPNKFSAFEVTEDKVFPDGPYQNKNGVGKQELIIPTARHVGSLGEMDFEEVKRGLHVARDRIEAFSHEQPIKHAMLFMNCRMEAGASLEHVHFQLIGSPVVSSRVERRQSIAQKAFEETGQTLIAQLVEWETQQSTRVVKTSKNLTSFCPFASRLPLTVWIAPNQKSGRFADADNLLDELAELTHDAVRRIETVLDRSAYNIMLHQASYEFEGPHHWYVEIFPRLTRLAGYEWGTDIWINPVSPESAARRLRAANKDE